MKHKDAKFDDETLDVLTYTGHQALCQLTGILLCWSG